MKKTTLLTFVICLLLGSSVGAREPAVVVTGWVSDENCGAKHTQPGGADCVKKCLKGGADIGHPEWEPQRMVLVTDRDRKIWVVENPEILKGHEGEHVRVTARFDAGKKSVRVTQVRALAGKPKK